MGSETRWMYYFSIFGHLQHWKAAQKHNNFARVGSKFWQTINKPSTNWQRFISFCQSGQISPNLVTLRIYLSIASLFIMTSKTNKGLLFFIVRSSLIIWSFRLIMKRKKAFVLRTKNKVTCGQDHLAQFGFSNQVQKEAIRTVGYSSTYKVTKY